jgi:homospermidine synthase
MPDHSNIKPEGRVTSYPVHGHIDGPVVMIGFGSIGRGALPLIERHFTFDRDRLIIIDPSDQNKAIIDSSGLQYLQMKLTPENYKEILTPLLTRGGGQGFCVNLSVDVASLDVMRLCRDIGCLYIDTATEPWPGFFFDTEMDTADRTNYALREMVRKERRKNPGAVTAVSGSGANPGMISWLAKQALVNLATDLGLDFTIPQTREDWGRLMQKAGVKGMHVAERDTQKTAHLKRRECFFNTWSVEGIIAEGVQPAELGWGTHEKWMPDNAHRHKNGCLAGIYLMQPGANTRVHSWCPTPGAQYGFLVSHNESISIADYFTLGDPADPAFRPTVHYAYHPCNHAVLSLNELFGSGSVPQKNYHLLDESEIIEGRDELGVLLYGHEKNAYWFGSQLTIEETRELAPYQNATGLQVTSGVLAGMAWALENRAAGVVEADEMDFAKCLAVQKPYLGTVKGYYTDWNPLSNRQSYFPEDLDTEDPWQFRNILVRRGL